MASFADALGLLSGSGLIESIIPFFLVYTVVFGILKRTEFVQTKELQASISAILALTVVLSPTARTFIMSLAPPLVTFAIIIFVFILILFSIGLKPKDLESFWGFGRDELNPMPWLFIAIGVIILIAAIASSFPDAIGSNINEIEKKAADQGISVNEYVNQLPVGQRIIFFMSLPQVMGLVILIIIFGAAGMLLIPPDPK